jgi:hypothetical protein
MEIPGLFIVTDSLIVVNNPFSSENVLDFFDKQSGKYLFSGAKKGKGPNEILSSSNLDYKDDRIQVLDPNLKKYLSYKIDIKNSTVIPKVTSYNQLEPLITKIIQIEPYKFVTDSYLNGKLFMITNLTNTKCEYFGTIPIEESEKITNINDRFQGSLKASPSGLYFAFGAFSTPYLCLYSTQDGLPNKKFELFVTKPEYNISNHKLIWADGNITGFMDIAISDNRIYALHSSLRKKDIKGRSITNLPKTIYEFDMEGKAICKYEAENYLIRITCDNNGKLFAIIYDDKDKEYKVVELLLD